MFGSGSDRTGSISKGLFRSYYNASAASNNLLTKGEKKNGQHVSYGQGEPEEPSASPDVKIEPPRLAGESILARAQGVQVFQPLSADNQGVIGELYVTNFKISFQTITFPDHRWDHFQAIQDRDKPPLKAAAKRSSSGTPDFSTRSDWLQLLDRVDAATWRITQANEDFHLCPSLPKCFVIPTALGDDAQLERLCGQLGVADERRPLVWCWSARHGAALCRMSSDTDRHTFVEAVKLAHPERKSPIVYDIGTLAPSLKEIRKHHDALRDLVLVESFSVLESADDKWFVDVENTRWLHSVSRCLELAYTVCDALQKQTSAILKESGDRDLNCVIAALVQLLMDPERRTIPGFQRLVEKEFVALGHRFQERLGLVKTEPDRESPVFLLFLDCVFQLTHTHPAAFAFTDAYLVTLYDTALLGVFRNFTLNCQRDALGKPTAPAFTELPRDSAWDTAALQPPSGSRAVNGLYRAQNIVAAVPLEARVKGRFAPEEVLVPAMGVAYLKVWRRLYLRFVPPLAGGGGEGEAEREQRVKTVCEALERVWKEIQLGEGQAEEEKTPSRRGSSASVAKSRPPPADAPATGSSDSPVVRRHRHDSGASLLSSASFSTADARRRSQLMRPITGAAASGPGSHSILTFQK
ncbi:myotubularin-related protein 10-B-like [Paramacrobiotus metropolitanus]|uniref:myotubularin-related protein 10-B-like n=1 Tax=Paramacrobiotus metropolitanus TaxID=2943436 RepID=UPI002445B882|nr:myotubularin-related protein 10-B-like [Paramacrobiotus metropolitanus]